MLVGCVVLVPFGAFAQTVAFPRDMHTIRPAAAELMPPPSVMEPAAIVSETAWPAADITREHARCAQLLRGLDIVAKPLAPLREHECGTPAPYELISVGRSPQVAFSPPVTGDVRLGGGAASLDQR